MPVVLDLFCGAGGMSLGFEMAGYQVALGVEKEELPYQTHCHNFGNRCHHGRVEDITDPHTFIRTYELNRVDVIIGGPPCQGFSRVGRGKIRHLRNDPKYIHDPRNQYYQQFFRFVEVLQPVYFVMENVPDLQYYADENGLIIEQAHQICQRLGYTSFDWRVLRADHYGVPQTRQRLFIIGNRVRQPICWPTRTHLNRPVTVWQAISDLPTITHGTREDDIPYRARNPLTTYQRLMRKGCVGRLYNHQTRWHNEQDLQAFTTMPEGGKYVDLDDEFKRYRDDIFKDKYWKLYRDQPSWTVEAHIGKDTYRHIYPSRPDEPEPARTISVREAARLQSFPDRFRFKGPFTRQFMQVGNAVPPLLARVVAHAILPGIQIGMAQVAALDAMPDGALWNHLEVPPLVEELAGVMI